VDLIFGAVVSFALAAEFQSRIYASGGRQVDSVLVTCGVVFILCCVVEGNYLTIHGCFDNIKL
jgi:hypothetical protein